MLLGSNNSLTYLKSPNLWFRMKSWFVRCQEIPYEEQYKYWGVRFFDLRLYINRNNRIMVKNNAYEYPLFSLYQMLGFFDRKGDVMLRVTLDASFEDRMKEDYKRVEDKFCEVCHIIDTIYKRILLCGGTRRYDGRQIYEFKERESIYGCVEVISPEEWSPMYRFVSKWLTFLIGHFNRRYIEKFKSKHVFLVLNYVNRR